MTPPWQTTAMRSPALRAMAASIALIARLRKS